MGNTEQQISVNIPIWQLKLLKQYFGENDKTSIEHWAYNIFDDALKAPKVEHEEVKSLLSAERFYFYEMENHKAPITPDEWLRFAESFASLAVEQAEEKYEDRIILFNAKIEALEQARKEKDDIQHNYELLFSEINEYCEILKQRPNRLGAIIDPISNDIKEILNQFLNNGK
jgi:hypothetical protein